MIDPRTTTALLYLNGVNVSFDGFRALNNLSFTIEPGEMRAIIGPNGAGKTTMMDVVTGKTRPDTGDVYFDGSYDLSRLDETQIALLGIGRKFQKPTVFDMHTVDDNIGFALKGDRRARRPCSRAKPPKRRSTSTAFSARSVVAGTFARRGLALDGQSNGSRSGCCSPRNRSCCRRRAGGRHDRRRDQADGGAAQGDQSRPHVAWSSHDMTFVRELGVKVTCLHEGSVLAEGTIDQVSENEAWSRSSGTLMLWWSEHIPSGKLGLLPPPLRGRGGGRGWCCVAHDCHIARPPPPTPPQPAAGLPASGNSKAAKPRQAGVWLGRGAH